MLQTDQNINPNKSIKSVVVGDTADNMLTHISDIPVYDALAKKQFASPEKIELVKESFTLMPLKTFRKKNSVNGYNPITNKIIIQKSKQPVEKKQDKTTITAEIVPNDNKADTAYITADSLPTFNVLTNKITKKDRAAVHNIFPIVESVQKSDTNHITEHLINKRPTTDIKHFTNIDWITGFNIIILIYVVYTRVVFGKFFKPIFQSAFIYNLSVRIFNEKNLVLIRLSSILNILFFITISAFVTLCFDFYGFRIYNLTIWQHYFVFLTLHFIIYFVRKIINFLIGFLLRLGSIINEFAFQENLYLKISGILIFPVILITPYMPENIVEIFFVVVISVLLLFYFFRILRLISITIRKGFSIFYLILYFCALEIGPCLVIFKMLGNLSKMGY